MKAIIINEPGGVENLIYTEIEKPVIKSDEVLVQVKAISINPVDVKVRAGYGIFQMLKNEKPLILGWDISGVVTEAGSDATFKVGDEVFGMVRFPGHGKAYAEYVAAPASHLALKPAGTSYEQAAATTLAALTAYQSLVTHGKIQSGQKVLIHESAGGVGHFAVQIAKHLGAHVTATSSIKNKEFVMGLGADAHIDYHGHDWENNADEFDFVVDTVGGDNIGRSLMAVKEGGMIVSIPSALSEEDKAAANAKKVNGLFFLVTSNGENMKILADWLKLGVIKPFVSRTFGFDEMANAHQVVESGRTVGKVIVRL